MTLPQHVHDAAATLVGEPQHGRGGQAAPGAGAARAEQREEEAVGAPTSYAECAEIVCGIRRDRTWSTPRLYVKDAEIICAGRRDCM